MSSPQPFRFLDLPQEIQLMILEHYYVTFNITVRRESRGVALDGIPRHRTIDLVSRTLHKIATPIFRNAFTGVLTFSVIDGGKPQALEYFCAVGRYAWIREKVQRLEIGGYEGLWNRRLRMEGIKCIVGQFPKLQTVSLNYVVEKNAYRGHSMSMPKLCWEAVNARAYKEAFLQGSRDDKYDAPVEKLQAKFLRVALEVAGMHHVKVLVNSSVWWQTLEGRILLILGVSFQVTPDGWKAVDRDWRAGRDLDRSRSQYSSTGNFDAIMKMGHFRKRVYEYSV